MQKHEVPERHPFFVWFGGVSGAGFLGGGRGFEILSPFFWQCTAVLYVSLISACADVWFFPKMKSAHKLYLLTFFIVIGAAYATEVVFLPAPLDITTYTRLGNYPVGSKIYGKEWKPEWIDLRVRINPPKYDYSDLDLQITPDLSRADEPWQATEIPCEPFQEVNLIPVQRTPVNPPGPTEESGTIGPTVRMRCPILPNQSG